MKSYEKRQMNEIENEESFMDPLVTIIVPIYQIGPYLDQCVASLVKQTYAHLEILLVDDGAIDGRGEVCNKWAEKDSRIRVIHKENSGLCDARDVGVEAAKGDYLIFIDGDDCAAPEYCERLVTVLLMSGADFAICGFSYTYDDGRMEPYEKPFQPKDEKRFFVKFWGAKVSMHSWRGHALKIVRVLFVSIENHAIVAWFRKAYSYKKPPNEVQCSRPVSQAK